jgi:molybdenum cofactor biosynthesis protein B
MAVHEHRAKAKRGVGCAVITVSDTRSEATDESGRLIRALLEEEGHAVRGYRIVRDEAEEIRRALGEALSRGDVEAVILNGGTGISPRDGTYEVVSAELEKRLEGFGELFRFLSYEQVGAAAIMSRAVAGVAKGKVVVSLPGSRAAVELAMRKLLLPELGHMVSQLQSP